MSMITIAFATHRPETLLLARNEILHADLVILEEPFNPDFIKVLKKEIPVSQYLASADIEYHEYGKRLIELLQGLYFRGKSILQVEPYLESLLKIQMKFAEGETVQQVTSDPLLAEVYEVERKATGALIRFYKESVKGNFYRVIDSVIDFARSDAARIVLRDRLRAERLSQVIKPLPDDVRVYVEAGYIHMALFVYLVRLMRGRSVIKPLYVMRDVVRSSIRGKLVLSPGDRLTLGFVFKGKFPHEKQALLAARSILYVKLIEKEELIPEGDFDFPHTMDEINTLKMIAKLDMEDCRTLFENIRSIEQTSGRLGVHKCRRLVEEYLENKR